MRTLKNTGMEKKRRCLLIWLAIFPLCIFAQESNSGKCTLGITGGIGNTVNGYRQTNYNNYSFYDISNQFSLGLDVGVFLTDKQRLRLGVGYSQNHYGVNWPETYVNYDYTKVNLHNLVFSLNYDYLVLQKNKFQVFVSPGIFDEIVVDRQNHTYRADGTTTNKNFSVYPDGQYPDNSIGFNASVLCKYQLKPWVAITLTPYYDIYFNKFTSQNDSPYMKYGGKFGFEFSL